MQKHILLLILLLTIITPAFSMDIGLSFDLSNWQFEEDRSIADSTYSGNDYFYGLTFFAKDRISDDFSIDVSYTNDEILRNVFYTLFYYHSDFFEIGLGPFFGVFNDTSTLLNNGISTSVKLQLPGKTYFYVRGDSTIGGRLVETGDYLQEKSKMAWAFYVPNAICSINIENKKYTEKKSTSLETVDSLTKYYFQTDLFKKNMPYNVILDLGYQILKKEFIETSETTHQLNTVYMAIEIKIQATENLTFLTDLESSVFTFGSKELKGISNPGPNGFLFRMSAGFQYSFE